MKENMANLTLTKSYSAVLLSNIADELLEEAARQ